MKSPMDMMLDQADFKCVHCGVSAKVGCDCIIKIECPKCGTSKSCERDALDPEGTAKVVSECPDCSNGEGSIPQFFDANGNELDFV